MCALIDVIGQYLYTAFRCIILGNVNLPSVIFCSFFPFMPVSNQPPHNHSVTLTADNASDPFATIVATARYRFPENYIHSAFPVCWPVYQLRLGLAVNIRTRLSTAELFCLRLLDQSGASAAKIAEWMGLPNIYVHDMLANLAKQNLVTLSTSPLVDITPNGRSALQRAGQIIQNQARRITIYFDPLCCRILPDAPNPLKRSEAEKAPEFLLPTENNVTKPTIKAVASSQMRDSILAYCNGRRSAKNTEDTNTSSEAEIVEVLHVDRIYKNDTRLMFSTDKVVVVMTPRVTNASNLDLDLAVYHRYKESYLEEETNELRHLGPTWKAFVPSSLHPESDTRPFDGRQLLLDRDQAGILEKRGDLKYELNSLQVDMNSGVDQEFHQQRVKNLKAELKQRKAPPNLEILTTTDHRPLLLKAIREAQYELVVVSAFLSERAFDQELCDLLVGAICERRVQVRIAWGLGTQGGSDALLTRSQGEALLKRLKSQIRKTDDSCRNLLQIRRLATHEKFLVCDKQFCAWGSFNWLSYRGERDRGFRQESSTLSYDPDHIAQWHKHVQSMFEGT